MKMKPTTVLLHAFCISSNLGSVGVLQGRLRAICVYCGDSYQSCPLSLLWRPSWQWTVGSCTAVSPGRSSLPVAPEFLA
jgi:hypothetical protein